MELAKTFAISLLGLSGTLVEVEADISSQLPNFVLVGLPDASLSEATARVKAAITNSKLALPTRRVTVNLSPASVPKQGSSFDLAISIAVLGASGQLPSADFARAVHVGELGLDGAIKPVHGILPTVMAAKKLGVGRAIVPLANLAEARLVDGIEVFGFEHLTEVVRHYGGQLDLISVASAKSSPANGEGVAKVDVDIADILGQEDAVDALIAAAAGGHHMLMVGPPGAGKTMMAERLASILPDLSLERALETTAIHSIAGKHRQADDALITRPPFEAPHHGASVASLIGGGTGLPRPGLISLANNGVLFLDEAPEFQLPVLESLRQPLESGEVAIHRSAGTAKFPARFQLVMAANPCPCGRAMDAKRGCTCSAISRLRYKNKLSGPLLDRVDIRMQIRPVNAAQLAIGREQQNFRTSKTSRVQVMKARQAMSERLKSTPWQLNSEIPGTYLRRKFKPALTATRELDRALELRRISMRGYDRCLRLAWTLADLEGAAQVAREHLQRAMFLRGSEDLLGG